MTVMTDMEYYAKHMAERYDVHIPIPRDLFNLATRDPIINSCLELWRNGRCTWEGALILTIQHLHAQKEKLMETAIEAALSHPPPIIIPKSDTK